MRGTNATHLPQTLLPSLAQNISDISITSANLPDVIEYCVYFSCILFSLFVILFLEKYLLSWTMADQLKSTDVIPQVVTSEDIFNALSVMSTEITALSKIVRNKLKAKEQPLKKPCPKKPLSKSSPPPKDAKRKPKPKPARNE